MEVLGLVYLVTMATGGCSAANHSNAAGSQSEQWLAADDAGRDNLLAMDGIRDNQSPLRAPAAAVCVSADGEMLTERKHLLMMCRGTYVEVHFILYVFGTSILARSREFILC